MSFIGSRPFAVQIMPRYSLVLLGPSWEVFAICSRNCDIVFDLAVLTLQEGKYYNKQGDYFPPASNPCSKKCDSKRSCDTCGPYTVSCAHLLCKRCLCIMLQNCILYAAHNPASRGIDQC